MGVGKLNINELLSKNVENKEPVIDRVLWSDNSGHVITIDINSPKALPCLRDTKEINDQIESGILTIIENDPFYKVVIEEALTVKERAIRDKAWKMIKGAAESEPDIFYSGKRGTLLREIANKYGLSIHTVYKYLRRYWQRGKYINALLPDYWRSGGKGKEKKLGGKKVGRPRKTINISETGVNVCEEDKRIFKIAISRYYNTPARYSLTDVYHLMIKDFYTEGYRYENGVRIPILIPISKRPDERQFKYWHYKNLDLKKQISSRLGSRKYELNNRSILGRSESGILGPASKFLIDATVGDVYLVSSINPDGIIGRPIIYALIDVFSRMITGIYVGMEGPSWNGAMMALANTVRDKKEFCAEYGIEIQEWEWPCKYLPETILADRGEMESKKIDTLINTLHVKIENTPPYRPDLKGIVEQYFRTLNIKTKPFLPGAVNPDFQERGATDYRVNAKLTLKDFTAVVIHCVLEHNQHPLDKYVKEEMMISDNIEATPLEIWNWGITNRSGNLRKIDENIVKLCVMPTAPARVTERGIRFKSQYYKSERAMSENWFETARNKGSWEVKISYDPRNLDSIYIMSEDGRDYDKCFLTERNNYFQKSIYEIEYFEEHERQAKEKNAGKTIQSKIDRMSKIEDIVKKAEKNQVNKKNTSKSSRIKGIRENRAAEKMANRKKESFDLGEVNENTNTEPLIPEDDDQSYKIIDFEYLKKKQEERLNRKDE